MKPAQICNNLSNMTPETLVSQIKQWGKELGFADIGISDIQLSAYEADYFNWIGENFHGEMAYMERHGTKRTRPNELEPGTTAIISVRMNYFDSNSSHATQQLHSTDKAYISRYALGKDYHKLMRKRLQALANKIDDVTENFQYRAFSDSAPVLERPIAEKAGLGFIGKNSLIIHPRAGSWFFLGEIYTNLNLPVDAPFTKQGCGPCNACIVECPTQAIVDNAVVDARRCISYLTIEFTGSIPTEFRALMGNRIYGCDDCQLVCPWNKFTEPTNESAFKTLNDMDSATLLELWEWTETEFMKRFEGSAIRRIGYAQWNRNLAVAIGNMQSTPQNTNLAITALQNKRGLISSLVDEHIDWALEQLSKYNFTRPGNLAEQDLDLNQIEPTQIELNQQKQDANLKSLNSIKPFIAKKYYLPKH